MTTIRNGLPMVEGPMLVTFIFPPLSFSRTEKYSTILSQRAILPSAPSWKPKNCDGVVMLCAAASAAQKRAIFRMRERDMRASIGGQQTESEGKRKTKSDSGRLRFTIDLPIPRASGFDQPLQNPRRRHPLPQHLRPMRD